MDQRIAPSARIEEAIERVLLHGLDEPDALSQVGRLGAQLVLQRAVEDELTVFLGRARYERTDQPTGSPNGHRPRRIQTAEGELVIRHAPGPRLAHPVRLRDDPRHPHRRPHPAARGARHRCLVRGLSDRDIESLAREAGLGQLSRTTVSTICRQLRDRYRAFRAKSLADVRLLALMLDAIYLPVRPDGPKEGVLVAWGFTTDGERVLLDVALGQRKRADDWIDLGRGLLRRGLRSPLLVVADGAPGLIRAVTELWPDADRQRCTVQYDELRIMPMPGVEPAAA